MIINDISRSWLVRYSYGTSDTSDTQVIQLFQVMQVRQAHLWHDFRVIFVFAMLTGYWQACHFVHNRPTCVQSLQAAKSYCCSVSNWASVFRAAPFNRDPIIVSISLDHNIILVQFESLSYKCTDSDLSPGIDYPCLQKLSLLPAWHFKETVIGRSQPSQQSSKAPLLPFQSNHCQIEIMYHSPCLIV